MNKYLHFKKKSFELIKSVIIGIAFTCAWTVIYASNSNRTTEIFLQQIKTAKITLSIKNKPLDTILDNICKQAKAQYALDAGVKIDRTRTYTLDVKGVTVTDALEKLLKESNYQYSLVDDKIIIKKREQEVSKTTVGKLFVSGNVLDSNKEPIVGATVIVVGTPIGAITDTNGAFTFLAEINSKVEVSFTGKKSVTLEIGDKTKTHTITLEDDALAMDDVVVTGYQQFDKRDNTGSITKIKAEDLNLKNVTNIAEALQGQVAGMIVTRNSARAGTSSTVQIRGTTTVLGNRDPIWVVDGIIQDDPISVNASSNMVDDMKTIIGNQVSWLNPDDIETISVLKDASATAIYGSRASNGVIVITLKKAKSDRVSVNYSGSINYQGEPNYGQYNLMNSQERIKFSEEAYEAGVLYGSEPIAQKYTFEGLLKMMIDGKISTDEYALGKSRLETLNTDWLSLLTRPTFSHKHNLSVTGMSGKVNYNISAGYNKTLGQEIGNSSENFTARSAIGIRVNDRLKVDMSINGSIATNKGYGKGVSPMNYALTTSRAIPAYEENGELAFHRLVSHYSSGYNLDSKDLGFNILNEMEHSYSRVGTNNLSLNLNLDYLLCSWLKYQFTGGYQYTTTDRESYSGERTYVIADTYRGYDFGAVAPDSPWVKAAVLPHGGELFTDNGKATSINIQNKLLISKNFSDESRLNIMLATEIRSNPKNTISNTAFGYIPERGNMLVMPTSPKEFVSMGNQTLQPYGPFEQLYNARWKKDVGTDNFFSLFATIAYSFRNRYVFNFSVRNDASNRFGQNVNKRIDPTYSFGLAWRVKDELFLKDRAKWLTDMTFKATYGIQGNALLNKSPKVSFKQMNTMVNFNDYYSKIMSIPNPNLSWERTYTWNFGLELRLFNAVNIVADYYTKRSNAIVMQDVPVENGLSQMDINGGMIYNRGAEVTLSFSPVNRKNFGFNFSINSSKNWNKVGSTTMQYNFNQFIDGPTDKIIKEGFPLGAIWSYPFIGLNPANGAPMYDNFPLAEGVIYNGDPTSLLTYHGSKTPDFTGGINLGLRYKKLTVRTNFSVIMGGVTRIASPYANFPSNGSRLPLSTVNISRDVAKRWKKPGDEKSTNLYALNTGGSSTIVSPFLPATSLNIYEMYSTSDLLVAKSSFLRCNNIDLSYAFGEALCEKLRIRSLTVSGGVNNLFVVASKKFNGYDPELGNSVMPKTFSFGVSIGF